MPRLAVCLASLSLASASCLFGGMEEIPLPPIETKFPWLPGVKDLPVQTELPPVLIRDDGMPVKTVAEWPDRRTELLRTLEHYATGHAPPAPGNVKGREVSSRFLAGGKVCYRLIELTFGPDAKLSLHIGVFTPAGPGPFPAVITPAGTPPGALSLPRQPPGPGQGKGGNPLLAVGLPAITGESPDAALVRAGGMSAADAETIASTNPALARGYAYVMFNHNDCGEDTTLRNPDGSWAFRSTRFYPAYQGYDWGLLRGWAWGVSRIIDYLETNPSIDPAKLIVTGVSRTGKSAMVTGAFDERIALTAPVVTGGGGVGAFRFSGEGRGGREGLDLMMHKYPNWFSPHLREFRGHTDRLPFDQHTFLALIAPRAFIALEGATDTVSLPAAVRASWLGAQPAFALLGATEKLGVHYADHGHAFTPDDWTAMLDFADWHLRGLPVKRRFDRFPIESGKPPANATVLWNGRDLSNWHIYTSDPAADTEPVWRNLDGILHLHSKVRGYLRTTTPYSNYRLHVEWRWPAREPATPNSGVILHLNGTDQIWPDGYEFQMRSGIAGQIVAFLVDIPGAPVSNERQRVAKLRPASENPLGEWNIAEITCREGSLEVIVNGVPQNRVVNLPVASGAIGLQMEGAPVEFRHVWLQPL